MQMLHQYCRALKMLSFGISHKPICLTQVTKKQNGRHVGGANIGFFGIFDPYIDFYYIQMLYQSCRALKMLSFGISHKPICVT